jgi:uncharacterized protein YutE (UPF0331/DUF86 family)
MWQGSDRETVRGVVENHIGHPREFTAAIRRNASHRWPRPLRGSRTRRAAGPRSPREIVSSRTCCALGWTQPRIQVVVLIRAPADLVHRVLRDGHLVLDPAARIRFEVQRRNEYFDLAPGAGRSGRGAEAVTDPELVARKLAFIEGCVRDLRTLARPQRICDDLREEQFAEHTLQLAIQAALGVGLHLVSDERLVEPETSRESSRLLGRTGVVAPALAERFERMAGFRNVVVPSGTCWSSRGRSAGSEAFTAGEVEKRRGDGLVPATPWSPSGGRTARRLAG